VNESQPGVVSELLSVDQAVGKLLAVAPNIPQMTVFGIAGPGDPLANPERTFKTFRRLTEQAPDIKREVSTNGLARALRGSGMVEQDAQARSDTVFDAVLAL
jgi:nitrogen fixation protein NifB